MAERFLQAVRERLEERDREKSLKALRKRGEVDPLDTHGDEDIQPGALRDPISMSPHRIPLKGTERLRGSRACSLGLHEVTAVKRPRSAEPEQSKGQKQPLSTGAQGQEISKPRTKAQNSCITIEIDDDSDEDCIDLVQEDNEISSLRTEKVSSPQTLAPHSTFNQPSALRLPSLFCDDDIDMDQDSMHPLPAQPEARPAHSTPLTTIDVVNTSTALPFKDSAEESTKLKREKRPSEDGKPLKRRKTGRAAVEKRGVPTRGHPSKAALERLMRSSRHRLFLVDKKDDGDTISCAVMGSNGNIYKCEISLYPSCECQDFQKRKGTKTEGPCKHLIFLFIRVLKVPKEDRKWWQVRLLPSELSEIRENAPRAITGEPGVMAQEAVLTQYQRASQGAGKRGERRDLEGECPICFESFAVETGNQTGNQTPENATTFCDECGNNFHSMCIGNWHRAQREPTCPLCRQKMSSPESGKKQGFLNLAQYSTAHEHQLTLAELYANTHQYIGRRGSRGRGRGRGHGRGSRRGRGRGRGQTSAALTD